MDAIVIAGGIPTPEEPLYQYTQGKAKALLDIAGKPMVQWVLDALSNAKHVENVIVIGLDDVEAVTCAKAMYHIPNQGRMLANIEAGINKMREVNPKAEYAIVTSADIPALTGEMVDWLVETAQQSHHDIYYGVVKREVMEKRYPGSNRTYTKLKDMEVCGADINIAHHTMTTDPVHLAKWEILIGRRKSPLKQAAAVGIWTLVLVLTGRLTLKAAVERATRKLNINARAIVWDYAEAAMDVDKPHQYEIMKADLEK